MNESSDELRRGANLFAGRTGSPPSTPRRARAHGDREARVRSGHGAVQGRPRSHGRRSGRSRVRGGGASSLAPRQRGARRDEKIARRRQDNLDAKIAEGNASRIAASRCGIGSGVSRSHDARAVRCTSASRARAPLRLDREKRSGDVGDEEGGGARSRKIRTRITSSRSSADARRSDAVRRNGDGERPTFAEALAYRATLDLAGGTTRGREDLRYDGAQDRSANPNMHVAMGRTLLAEGKIDRRWRTKEKRRSRSSVIWLPRSSSWADAYAKKGEIDLAVESYQDAWGFDHTDPTSLVNASLACHAAGRDTSAKAFGLKATQEFPNWGPGWVALGDARVGDKDIRGSETGVCDGSEIAGTGRRRCGAEENRRAALIFGRVLT